MNRLSLFSILAGIILTFSSCVDGTSVLPNSSGKANEMLLVMDDALYDSEEGQKIMDLFEQDVMGLAWDEPFFDVSRLNRQTYSELFRLARNIVYIDVSNMYTRPQIKLFKNLHAKDQSFVRVQAPDVASLDTLIENDGNRILSFLYTSERERTIKYFEKHKNTTVIDSLKNQFGMNILIPGSFNRQKFKDDFVWMAAGNLDARQYLAFYSYPYEEDSTFTKDFLLAKRDAYMKANIPGSIEGSYVKTSYVFEPTFRAYEKDGLYIAELRGLWDTEGDMMGGPFISQTVLDKENQMVITVEGFVYAPHKTKRNMMRQLETILYTLSIGDKEVIEEGANEES